MNMDMNEVNEIAQINGGANFWYGLRARPSGLGCHPTGTTAIIPKDLALKNIPNIKDERSVRHGAIAYSQALPQKEVEQFELVDLSLEEVLFDEDEFEDDILNLIAEPYTELMTTVEDAVNIIMATLDIHVREAFKKTSYFSNRKKDPVSYRLALDYCPLMGGERISSLLKHKLS